MKTNVWRQSRASIISDGRPGDGAVCARHEHCCEHSLCDAVLFGVVATCGGCVTWRQAIQAATFGEKKKKNRRKRRIGRRRHGVGSGGRQRCSERLTKCAYIDAHAGVARNAPNAARAGHNARMAISGLSSSILKKAITIEDANQ